MQCHARTHAHTTNKHTLYHFQGHLPAGVRDSASVRNPKAFAILMAFVILQAFTIPLSFVILLAFAIMEGRNQLQFLHC